MSRKQQLAIVVLLIYGFSGLLAGGGGESNSEFAEFEPCPQTPNCVSSLEDPADSQHYIEPLYVDADISSAFSIIINYLMEGSNIEIVASREGEYIHAVFTTKIMRFKDDVEFAFRVRPGGKAVVYIRSASRVGSGDMGKNRTRMEALRSALRNES